MEASSLLYLLPKTGLAIQAYVRLLGRSQEKLSFFFLIPVNYS